MRESRETKIDRLKAELVNAKEKANQWQARVRDIERQITEQENLEILQVVRSVASSPEALRSVLDMIRAVNKQPDSNLKKEE